MKFDFKTAVINGLDTLRYRNGATEIIAGTKMAKEQWPELAQENGFDPDAMSKMSNDTTEALLAAEMDAGFMKSLISNLAFATGCLMITSGLSLTTPLGAGLFAFSMWRSGEAGLKMFKTVNPDLGEHLASSAEQFKAPEGVVTYLRETTEERNERVAKQIVAKKLTLGV